MRVSDTIQNAIIQKIDWNKVENHEDCFIWTGYCDSRGYAQIKHKGKNYFIQPLLFQRRVSHCKLGKFFLCKKNSRCINTAHMRFVTSEHTNIKTSQFEVWNDDCFNVFPLIYSNSIDMILADLPYGTTACKWDSVLPLDLLWKEYTRILKPNGVVVLTASQPFTWKLCASNPDWFKYEIIWEKPNGTNPLLVKKQPFKVHENILVFYKKQPTYNPQMTYGHTTYSGFSDENRTLGEVFSGGNNDTKLTSKHKENIDGSRYPRSIQKFAQERGKHPTKKPVELMRWLIRTYTNPGDVVLDNTMGEGTTGVAALLEKRKFLGIELEGKYYVTGLRSLNKLFKKKGIGV
jgi:DNA modification methylase